MSKLKRNGFINALEMKNSPEEILQNIFLPKYYMCDEDSNRMNATPRESSIEKFAKQILAKMDESNAKIYAEIKQLKNEIQQVKIELNAEIKGINKRLDYIVKANNLKDLPNQ